MRNEKKNKESKIKIWTKEQKTNNEDKDESKTRWRLRGRKNKKSKRKVKSKKEIKSRTTAHAESTRSTGDTHQYPRRLSWKSCAFISLFLCSFRSGTPRDRWSVEKAVLTRSLQTLWSPCVLAASVSSNSFVVHLRPRILVCKVISLNYITGEEQWYRHTGNTLFL